MDDCCSSNYDYRIDTCNADVRSAVKVVSADIAMSADFACHDSADGSSSTFDSDSLVMMTIACATFADSPAVVALSDAALVFDAIPVRKVSVDVHFECFASFLMFAL